MCDDSRKLIILLESIGEVPSPDHAYQIDGKLQLRDWQPLSQRDKRRHQTLAL
jgi:hypothetical protein